MWMVTDFLFWVGESKTRWHRFKMNGERFKEDLRGTFFLTQKVVGL